MNTTPSMTTRDRIVVGSLTTLASIGCGFLLVKSSIFMFFENPPVIEAILIWNLVLCWLLLTFCSIAYKVIFKPDQKYFVNIITLIIFNSLLSVGALWLFWLYFSDIQEFRKSSDIKTTWAMGGISMISILGWKHILKRLNAILYVVRTFWTANGVA